MVAEVDAMRTGAVVPQHPVKLTLDVAEFVLAYMFEDRLRVEQVDRGRRQLSQTFAAVREIETVARDKHAFERLPAPPFRGIDAAVATHLNADLLLSLLRIRQHT